MEQINRRRFLAQSAAGLAGPAILGRAAVNANGTIRVAVVGLNGQGGAHVREYNKIPKVEVAALCDVDESVLAKRLKEIEQNGQPKPKIYTDYRKLLEDKSIDAVSIATPNHWHSLMGIWACQAEKDVYVEKPCSHTVWEGRQLVKAARKYNRVVQHGANSRSAPATREGMRMLHEGFLGEIYMSRGLCYKWRDTIGRAKEEPVPPGVDYDLWMGPAPARPFTRNRFHYNWHWQWNYGNGDLGNQGIHEVDLARWGLGVKYPTKVFATGAHFMFDDDQETPNTMVATYEFHEGGRKKMMVFEVRHWITNHEAGIGERPNSRGGNTIGNIYYGPKGYMAVDGYTSYKTFLGKEQEPGPARTENASNWGNFIDVMRSRKQADLNADIEEGHISCILVHLANISYRLGRAIEFDGAAETIKGDAEASKMLKRVYRAPYVVPEKV
jgi:predicted dehydrogenase